MAPATNPNTNFGAPPLRFCVWGLYFFPASFTECPSPAWQTESPAPFVPRSLHFPVTHFIFISVPAAVEPGESIDFAAPLALVELCVLAEAITFMGALAAADAGGIT